MGNLRMIISTDGHRHLTFREGRHVSSCLPARRTVPVGGLLLEYAPTRSPTNLTFQGGAIAPGAPVQLVFWGDWWNGPGQPLRSSLESAVQKIIAGPYTWALDQYGISQPTYRGSYVAAGSPQRFGWTDVQDFIQTLLDRKIFPQPDEGGGRNAYFVMMPQGSTDTTTTPPPCGAHGQQMDGGFLGLDPDHAWVAYVNNGNLDSMTSCFSHELAELLTDPELDGWYVQNVPPSTGEVGDLCDIRENWVHGVKVRSYWSNRDQMCVIPTDAFYSVCITGTIDERDPVVLAHGKAHGNPSSGLGFLGPACDFSKLEFDYTSYQHVESALLKATATDYHAPVFAWSVAGKPLTGPTGTVSFTTAVEYVRPGGDVRKSNDTISLTYSVNGASVVLTNDNVLGSFDALISVSVDEDPTQSALAINGAQTSGLTLSYVGLTIDEPAYQSAVKRCGDAARAFWIKTHPDRARQPGPVNPGPLHERDLTLLQRLPGWVTPEQRETLRTVIVDTAHVRTEAPEAADELRALLLGALGLSDRSDWTKRQHRDQR